MTTVSDQFTGRMGRGDIIRGCSWCNSYAFEFDDDAKFYNGELDDTTREALSEYNNVTHCICGTCYTTVMADLGKALGGGE